MNKRKVIMASVALSIAGISTSAIAIPLFFIFPIPRGSVDPDKIDATVDQRKLAMCAAYHQNVIDPEISGKREDSYHGDVVKAVMGRLSSFAPAKKLIGAYIGQWRLQSKQSYQAGQDYTRMLVAGCSHSNLPVIKLQYDAWRAPNASFTDPKPSVRSIPAAPIALEKVILSSDFPLKVRPNKTDYIVSTTLQVDRKGDVVDCFIEATSGSDVLDDTTCSLLKQRAKFSPAVEDGNIVVSEYNYVQRWQLSRGNASFDPAIAPSPPLRSPETTSATQSSSPVSQPISAPADRKISDDAILDNAMKRCDRIGFKRGKDDFKDCVMQQIRLLSDVQN